MRKFHAVFLLLFLFCVQSSFALNEKDEKKITNIIHGYVDSWNKTSGRGFADNFSMDSNFINIFGMHFHGKEAIQNRHNQIHDTFLKDSTFTITNLEISEVNPNLVMAFVRWKVDGFQKPGSREDEPKKTIEGIFSHVFVGHKDTWEITSTQNTLAK